MYLNAKLPRIFFLRETLACWRLRGGRAANLGSWPTGGVGPTQVKATLQRAESRTPKNPSRYGPRIETAANYNGATRPIFRGGIHIDAALRIRGARSPPELRRRPDGRPQLRVAQH